MKKTILVTGGAGFIGAHVTEALLKRGQEVVVLDDLSGGFVANIPKGVRFVKGSVTQHQLIDRLFARHRFSYVFHLAAYAAEGLSHFIKRFNYTNNLIGSVNLINASVQHRVKCFVFASSIAVYGKNQVPMTEDMTPAPEDPYGIAKFAVEQELAATRHMFGLNHIIFRPHNVYGEKQNIGDRYRNVIGIFMNQAMKKLPMTIFGDGTQTRAFSYIGDMAPVMARSIEEPKAYNQVFNIGADTPYSVNDLARVVSQAMGVSPNLRHLTSRNEVHDAYSSHDKIQAIFGKGTQTSLEEGIRRMATWARKVGARQSKPFKNIEITENLPSVWTQKSRK